MGHVARRARRPTELAPVQLVQVAYRHCKSIGAWGAGTTALDLVGIGAGPGVVVDDAPDAVVEQTLVGLAGHRSWDRFPSTL